MKRWILGVAVMGLAGLSTAWAQAYNGRISGTVDGQAIDVPMICEKMGKMLTARSDDSMRGRDVNGDGIVLTLDVMGDRMAVTANLQGKAYKFGGTLGQGMKLTAEGAEVDSRFSATQGKDGAAPAFDFDAALKLVCD